MKTTVHVAKYVPQFCAVTPGLLTILAGALHLGWTSPAIQEIASGNSTLNLTFEEAQSVVTSLTIGAAVGPFLMLVTADIFGRKTGILSANIPSIIGWVMTAVGTGPWVLYTGKFLGGIGLGMSITVVPIYIGEISSAEIRGGLTAMSQVMLAIGPIIQYVLVPYLNAQRAAVVSGLVPLIALPMIYWIPESPYYLLIKERGDAARAVFKTLRSNANVDEEYSKTKYTIAEELAARRGFTDIFVTKNCRNGLLLVCGMVTVNAASGVHMIVSYTHTLLQNISEDLPINALAFSLVVIPCVSIIVSTLLIDSVGKRPLFCISVIGCCGTTFGFGLYFHLKNLGVDVAGLTWWPVTCIVLYKVFVGLAIASFALVYLGELLATNVKVYAATIAKSYLSTIISVQNEIVRVLHAEFGFYATFYMFALGNLIALFYLLVMPETKGKTLQEIQILLGAKCKDDECVNNKI